MAAMNVTRAPRPGSKTPRLLAMVALSAAVMLIAGVVLLYHFWPFTESAVREELGSAASATVSIEKFRDTYFPPGCIAENVVFQRQNSDHSLISVRRIIIRAYPRALLHKHVSLLRAEGMHVILTASDLASHQPDGQRQIVDRLEADDAVLEIPRKQQSMKFIFHKFRMEGLGGHGPVKFAAEFDNPMPTGIVRTSGQFGPWNTQHSEETAVSGKYSLENADLSVFHGIAGQLSSTGEFHGTFKQMQVTGSTNSPQFEIAKTHHALPLSTEFTASVDASNGDVALPEVNARFGRNQIEVRGTIARGFDHKRKAMLDLRCDRGRIEDVFYPFIHSPTSPLAGDVAFTVKVIIPGGREPFEEKIDLSSEFRIMNAVFTHAHTQEQLNKIAENPDQKEPAETLADFRGQVELRDGVARFSSLSVEDQGAAAMFHGSYNLMNERVNFYGNLKTATSLTKTTHGISAVFAKVLEPFFKKKPHETVVPVKISGTYSHPSFGLNM
jgi:AsmA-like C-terminal region